VAWVKQQIREATACNDAPRFQVHGNDGIFGQFGRSVTVEENGRRRSHRCQLDRWLRATEALASEAAVGYTSSSCVWGEDGRVRSTRLELPLAPARAQERRQGTGTVGATTTRALQGGCSDP